MEDTKGAEISRKGFCDKELQSTAKKRREKSLARGTIGLSSSSGAACHTLLQIRTNHFAFTKHPEVKGGIKSANFASH